MIVRQNIQQSNLSVLRQLRLFGHGDLLSYYSLELFCLLMSLLMQSVAPSLRRGGEGLELWLAPGWVLRSKYLNLYTNINCL